MTMAITRPFIPPMYPVSSESIQQQTDDVPKELFVPTMDLRVACPAGTHFPKDEVLQQRWEYEGHSEWRDIQRVVIK